MLPTKKITHEPGWGDGLDLSGSDMRIEGNTIRDCRDKGISVGERSTAVIVDNLVANCHVGIASKDDSRADIRNTGLANLEIGVALYVKKPTFGPPFTVSASLTV